MIDDSNDLSMTREPDDLDAYIATLSEEKKERLIDAGIALDIAILLYRAREQKGLTQEAAAKLAGLQQQAVSRLETTQSNPRLDTVSTYLEALGYSLELRAVDSETGKELFSVPLIAPISKAARRKKSPQSHAAAR